MTQRLSRLFSAISMLIVFSAASQACLWMDTHNYYLFSVCSPMSYRERIDKAIDDNWKAYLGSSEEYFWFDAETVAAAAQAKGDALMVSYVRNLDTYLQSSSVISSDRWDYPTKQQLEEARRKILVVRQYAQSKLKTRLRSQHALLLMRCNMVLGRHSENITFWQQTASQFIETVYKEMMQNIYAGALLRTGRFDEAGRVFAEQGDWESLMTQYYLKRSFQAIRAEYRRDPNSAVLPFLVQDFVNNSQEAVDAVQYGDAAVQGKYFIRDISEDEARQMIAFAEDVVGEGRTRDLALWMAAKAWLEFMFGDKKQGFDDAQRAVALDGAERSRDNARVIALYITSAVEPHIQQLDSRLADELRWLDEKAATDHHYVNVKDRLTHQVLAPAFIAEGRYETALALYHNVGADEYVVLLDTMSVEKLHSFSAFVSSSDKSPLNTYLADTLQIASSQLYDLIGTKYMRLAEWGRAVSYLERVPVSFYADKGYAPYAALRSYTVEPWIRRQWLREDLVYGDDRPRPASNPKLVFAREMQRLSSGLDLLQKEQRCQRCYDLAVRYAQASYTGDCWFLLRDGKSVEDTVRVNEIDFAAQTRTLLREASDSKNYALREKALFALAYGPLHSEPWYDLVWDTEKRDDIRVPLRNSSQWHAFVALNNFEKQNPDGPAAYVSRCDEFKQFKKHYQ